MATEARSEPVAVDRDDGHGSFSAFYRKEFRPVVALAYALSGSRTAAEDLAQEAFLAAHRRWEEVAAYGSPGGWVRRVVANKAASRWRRLGAETRALARIALDRQVALPPLEPTDARFWAAVRGLPRNQRLALALRYLEDRSVEEIADVLDCAPATVRVHLHRARQNLARRVEQEHLT